MKTVDNELDEDVILDTDLPLNIDRHFRQQKQCSSLTRTSSSSDDILPIATDSIEKTDDNNNNRNEKSQKITEDTQPISIESLSLNEKKDDKPVENIDDNPAESAESNDTTTSSTIIRRRRK